MSKVVASSAWPDNSHNWPAASRSALWLRCVSVAQSLIAQSLALLALFIGLHYWLQHQMLHHGLKLGAVSPKLTPLYAYWRPHFKTGLLIAVGVLFGAIIWFLRRGLSLEVPTRRWLILTMLSLVVLAPVVCTIDGKGLERIAEPYTRTDLEFIGLVPLIDSPRTFLRSFVERLPELPMHAQTHGPGAGLLLWTIDRMIAPGPLPAALLTILLSALSLPAVYLWGKEFLPERSARLATMFCVMAPNFLMFTATAMDAIFAMPLIWSCCCFWKARAGRYVWQWGALCGLAAAVAALMTFSMAFLGLWGMVVFALTLLCDRTHIRSTCQALLSAACAFLVFYVALFGWSGYNILEMLWAAFGNHHAIMSGHNHHVPGQHWYLAVANLAVFAGCTGLPLVVLWIRESVSGFRNLRSTGRNVSQATLLVWSFTVAIVVLAALPLYTMEVERIWIFLVPFVALAAASYLGRSDATLKAQARVVMFALAAQTLVTEALLTTYW